MDETARYEILGEIARGDFASVYRANDRELKRDVAVKQIHPQYLDDPKRLEQFWAEAQLLASLQHPNIVTIYDIVRSRGWLILELMRASLADGIQKGPVDLEYLRFVLACCANALRFLHSNGIIHGDVKPSNMLVDAQNRVKLGDFGLARRASSEEGSLLKGTTKYMAPELASDQFGPVGPASDLYSLGFSTYELMCGPHFETLFPGLDTFGRDRQIAWLMWHAAPDRNLPEIHRVLQGVPDDLASVIQRLVAKDQKKRFRSAQKLLRCVTGQMPTLSAEQEEEDVEKARAKAEAAGKKRRLRIVASVAVACSLLLCMFMLFKPSKPAPPPLIREGLVAEVQVDPPALTVDWWGKSPASESNSWKRTVDVDSFVTLQLFDRQSQAPKSCSVGDLQPGFKVQADRSGSRGSGQETWTITAYQPEVTEGKLAGEPTIPSEEPSPDDALRQLQIESDGELRSFLVHPSVKILLNDREALRGKPVRLTDLKEGDKLAVSWLEMGDQITVREVRVWRVFEYIDQGHLEQSGQNIRFVPSDNEPVALAFAENCRVVINDRNHLNGLALEPADLRNGDKVRRLVYGLQVTCVEVFRQFEDCGTILQIDSRQSCVDVQSEGNNQPTTLQVPPECEIVLRPPQPHFDWMPQEQRVSLQELQRGDRVQITHDSLDRVEGTVLSMIATRPTDPNRWAILIGIPSVGDDSPVADSQLLCTTLMTRSRVPVDHVKLLIDQDRESMLAGMSSHLDKTSEKDTIIVYVAGDAHQDSRGGIYLSAGRFGLWDLTPILERLVSQLEACRAREKVLLLDCRRAGSDVGLKRRPSTAEMLEPFAAGMNTITAIASCRRGEHIHQSSDGQSSLFVQCLSEGFSGRGDSDGDDHVDTPELWSYVKKEMTRRTASKGVQEPQLFGSIRP